MDYRVARCVRSAILDASPEDFCKKSKKWSGRQDCPDLSGLCQGASFLLRKLGIKERVVHALRVRSNCVLILGDSLRE